MLCQISYRRHLIYLFARLYGLFKVTNFRHLGISPWYFLKLVVWICVWYFVHGFFRLYAFIDFRLYAFIDFRLYAIEASSCMHLKLQVIFIYDFRFFWQNWKAQVSILPWKHRRKIPLSRWKIQQNTLCLKGSFLHWVLNIHSWPNYTVHSRQK